MAKPSDETDLRWMLVALTLGRRGQGNCWPNPAVGCVIVKSDRVIGRGWTQPGGRPHAEAMALAQAGAAARDATAYVTLEPCAHQGQTPPCAGALIDAGIARVVTAIEDPDPRVNGGGHAMLRAAGIQVDTGVCAAEAAWDHSGFLSRVRRGRPVITLKLAMSLDGKIATATGESKWITGPDARKMGHALRARHDAVLIGSGTARADDPTLTVRGLGAKAQPVRIVVSDGLDLPVPSNLTQTTSQAQLWVVHSAAANPERARVLEAAGARLFEVPEVEGTRDLNAVLAVLGEAGLNRIYCEGGGTLAASFLRSGLVDELAIFTAGFAIGAEGRAGVSELNLKGLTDAKRFHLLTQRAVGPDLFSHWVRNP
ncbi:MAG: bifunctional diaminohydroxyphosphoribosylaminopyrimidine deaminase/5-amino-6-(5-phosphoribosylamino)uracil reductase RibD [Pseudomonadota bacterium]